MFPLFKSSDADYERQRKTESFFDNTGLCLLFGLCNVISRFVLNLARIAAPLNNKLLNDQPKYFGTLTAEECSEWQEFPKTGVFTDNRTIKRQREVPAK